MSCSRPKLACFLFSSIFGALLMLAVIFKQQSRISSYRKDLQEVSNTSISDQLCWKVCGQDYSQQITPGECCLVGSGQLKCKIKSTCVQDYITARQNQILVQNQKLNSCFGLQIFFSVLAIGFACKICMNCRTGVSRRAGLQRAAAFARVMWHLRILNSTNRQAGPIERRSLLSESFISENKSQICAVCLDAFDELQVTKWVCGHIFHRECAEEWIQHNNTCPVCRAKQ